MIEQDLILEIGKIADQGFKMHGSLFNQAENLIKSLLKTEEVLNLQLCLGFVGGEVESFCIQKIYINEYGDVEMSGIASDGDTYQYDIYDLPDLGIFYLCDAIYEKYKLK